MRSTPNHWAAAEVQAAELLAAVAPDPAAVWEIKLIEDGWGYGHSLTGTIAEVACGPSEFGKYLTAWVWVVLTEDSDPNIIGYKAGERVKVDTNEIEWAERPS